MGACGESLRLKDDREAVAEVVPIAIPDVWRGPGLEGPHRPSISGPGGREEEGKSPGLG